MLFNHAFPLRWLPDETVYSLAARYHRLTGYTSPHTTAKILFGVDRRRAQHDLPTGINHLTDITSGLLGQADEIIKHHTLLPYFLPFKTAHIVASALSALKGTSIGSLKYQLGILTSRFRAHHPLKACDECMREDETLHGVAYWHVTHQLPGSWICIRHQSPLKECKDKSNGLQAFDWWLPSNENMEQVFPPSCLNTSILDQLTRLAQAAQLSWILPGDFYFNPQRLLQTYLFRLEQLGLQTANGSLRMAAIAKKFTRFCVPLRVVPEFHALPVNEATASAQIGRLLRKPCSGTHPLRHHLLIIWLFDSWERFWSHYHAPTHDTPSDSIEQTPESPDIREQLLSMVLSENLSLSTAARALGVDPSTAMAFASASGVCIQRRPKKINAPMKAEIIKELSAGHDKTLLAEKFGVSIVSVNRIVRTEPGLEQQWIESRFALQLTKSRSEWKRLSAKSGHIGIKLMRKIDPGTYAWLYRNDRVWLLEHNKHYALEPQFNSSHVNWDSRDNELAEQIAKATMTILSDDNAQTLSIHQLMKAVPDLYPKMDCLDRLPKTAMALKHSLGTNKRAKSRSGEGFFSRSKMTG